VQRPAVRAHVVSPAFETLGELISPISELWIQDSTHLPENAKDIWTRARKCNSPDFLGPAVTALLHIQQADDLPAGMQNQHILGPICRYHFKVLTWRSLSSLVALDVRRPCRFGTRFSLPGPSYADYQNDVTEFIGFRVSYVHRTGFAFLGSTRDHCSEMSRA
jgi:hypothetical protein